MSDEEDLSAWGDALAEQADSEDGASDDPWGDALSEQADVEAANADAESISSAAFDELASERGDRKNKFDLDGLIDIPVTLQLECGSEKVCVRNCLYFTQDSVI